jgi:hypothetical protein
MSHKKRISVLGEFFRRRVRQIDIDARYEPNMNRAVILHVERPATQDLVDQRREQLVNDVVAQVAQAGDDIGNAVEVHAQTDVVDAADQTMRLPLATFDSTCGRDGTIGGCAEGDDRELFSASTDAAQRRI